MTSLGKFARLSAANKLLFLKALTILAMVRLALTITNYKVVEKHIAKPGAPVSEVSPGRIAWAIRNMAPLVPGASCLTQALAAQHLMARSGKASTVRIGVAKEDSGKITAHAWLVWDDKVVIGQANHDLSRYVSIADLAPDST